MRIEDIFLFCFEMISIDQSQWCHKTLVICNNKKKYMDEHHYYWPPLIAQ